MRREREQRVVREREEKSENEGVRNQEASPLPCLDGKSFFY